MTDEDHDVASCLLMLANSDSATLLTLETTGFGDDVRGICNNNRTSRVEDDDWEKGEEASISSSMNQGLSFSCSKGKTSTCLPQSKINHPLLVHQVSSMLPPRFVGVYLPYVLACDDSFYLITDVRYND
ncbi:hypothetical protein OIU76_021775 [Salix suchowensis]|nr:hypothetical protein OIU76_021775 [Salix suchowensis]